MKQIFWKTKTFFKKLEYRFSVEITKIENATFPYKTALSEANVKNNKWEIQNRPITKNWVLTVATSFFRKYYFSLRTSCKVLIWCTNDSIVDVHTFRKCWSLFEGAFSLWVSLRRWHKAQLPVSSSYWLYLMATCFILYDSHYYVLEI